MSESLEEKVYEIICKKGACFYSDIARELKVSNQTARDICKALEREGKVVIHDKGLAKLVVNKHRTGDKP